jgi:hypothetical protein
MTSTVRALLLLEAAAFALAALVHAGVLRAGTLVGVFTIIVGVGPRSAPDVVYHLIMIGLLGWGLLVTTRGAGSGPGVR